MYAERSSATESVKGIDQKDCLELNSFRYISLTVSRCNVAVGLAFGKLKRLLKWHKTHTVHRDQQDTFSAVSYGYMF